MTTKPTISLCMIVRDEEEFLKSCISAIQNYVDEINIVDTGSKDSTVEIARSFNASIKQHKWDQDFSQARNISLQMATKDWVLVLDADETISPKDLQKLQKQISTTKADALSFVQRNYFKKRKPTSIEVSSDNDNYVESKQYSGWFPSRLVRLFRNNKGFKFSGTIHELVEPSIKKANGIIEKTQIPIHHFKVESKKSQEKKKQTYLEMGLKQIKLTPSDPKPHYEVGQIYLEQDNYNEAINHLAKCLELIGNSKDKSEHKGTFILASFSLGKAYVQTSRYKDAINIFIRIQKYFPNSHIIQFLLGKAYAEINNVPVAIEHYIQAAKLKPEDAEIHNNLANQYARIADFDMAINEFKIALKLSPDNATIHRNLGATYFGAERYARAYDHFVTAVELNPAFGKDLKDAIEELKQVKNKKMDIEYSFSINN